MNSTNEIIMVRYGRVNGLPKNCLFTIKRGDVNIRTIALSTSRIDLRSPPPSIPLKKMMTKSNAKSAMAEEKKLT